MSVSVSLGWSWGGDEIHRLTYELARLAEVEETELLFAVTRQQTRIVERPSRGVDINGTPFAPYNETNPYWYTPGGHTKDPVAAARRFVKKLVGPKGGGGFERRGATIRFASYGAYKRALGRDGVDLRGPRPQHMLDQTVVRLRSAYEAIIGIYGDAADRAQGHNTGAGPLPKREWFGIGRTDEDDIVTDLETARDARLKKLQ